MRPTIHFEAPEGETPTPSSAPATPLARIKQPRTGRVRRIVPPLLAGVATLAWFAAIGYALASGRVAIDPASLGPIDVGALLGGGLAPVMLVWLAALVLQRTDPLLEHRLDIAQNMNRAFAPVDAAEARVKLLNSRLTKSVEQLDVAGKLAAERIGSLEQSFRGEISELFSVTADTEAKATAMREALRRERDALGALCAQLDDTLAEAEQRLGGATQSLAAGTESLANQTRTSVDTLDGVRVELDRTAGETADRLGDLHARLETARTAGAQAAETIDRRLSEAVAAATATVDQAGQTLISHLDGAERRLSERTTRTVDGLTAQIDAAGENLSSRLESLSQTVSGQIAAAQDTLEGGMGRIEDRVGTVEAMARSLSQDLASTGRTLAETAERTVLAARELDDGFGDKISQLADGAEAAMAKAQTAARDIHRQAEDMRRLIDDTMQAATDSANRINETIVGEMSAIPETVDEAVEGVLTPIRTGNRALVQEMELLNDHAQTLEQAMEARLAALNHAAREHSDTMAKQTERLSTQWTGMIDRAETANTRITAAVDGMETRAERIQTIHDALLAALDSADKRVEAQGRQIAALSEDTVASFQAMLARADQVVTRLSDADGAVATSLAGLSDAGDRVADRLSAHRQTLEQERGALETGIAQNRDTLASVLEDLRAERDRVDAHTAQMIDRSGAALDRLSTTLETLDAARTATETTIQQAADRFVEQASEIREMATLVDDGTAEAAKRLEQRLARTVSRSVEASGSAMDQLAALYRGRFAKLSEETAHGFERALALLKQTAQSTNETSNQVTAHVRDEADRLAQMSRDFEAKAAELAARRQEATEDEFIRASSFIIERLASDSIDVTKVLMDDVPDDAWAKFLAGDRSRFARQALKIGTPHLRQRIRERYDTDGEFRTAASKYVREFEGLLEQAAQREGGNALSTTLISSDLGKLYTTLVQALRKAH
ncbi:hypothetical protein EV659_102323 [Rhodothalassium salexigens DSM 2132]|uniref:Apolipoprotein A1/A4/E domain-containing protein n=1 Tax=Rhodothalassium salexigens DSM 2132 TaxID=1188247 RepID=A0A4R2PS57_RHOSA|nr:hypothetical protein [Rhodothalassium salexigens]MBB4210529.1 HAMP domain-containing protein [Rhodothalassium salexigens DSM 2132]MBK1638060.1 hypothetical protein [Rhodothalassium salexigens DSM 2132]TCP37914.1 hypothetical protein EV659_102323 [Rhodothalassium salexigens DSM 2132]